MSGYLNPAVNKLIQQTSRQEGIKDDMSRIVLGDSLEQVKPDKQAEKQEPVKQRQERVIKKKLTAFERIVRYIEKRHRETHELPKWVRVVIKASSLILFIVSVGISSVFSFIYFNERNGPFVACLFVVMVVGSSNLLQTISFKIMFRSLKSFLVGVILLLLGFSSMLFSMTNTISALYNGRSKAIITNMEAEQSASHYAILEQNYNLALKAYQDADLDVSQLLETLNGLAVGSYNYNLQRQRHYNSKLYRDDLKAKADAAFALLQESKKELPLVRDTFETFLGNQTGYSGEQVEFVLSLFPAISADLLAPICLALFLFF
jgi:energy-coupling factor transporter transmembrane protein EcfT